MDTNVVGVVNISSLKEHPSGSIGNVVTALVATRFVVVAETDSGVSVVRLSTERPLNQVIELTNPQAVFVEDAALWHHQEPSRWQQIASQWPKIVK